MLRFESRKVVRGRPTVVQAFPELLPALSRTRNLWDAKGMSSIAQTWGPCPYVEYLRVAGQNEVFWWLCRLTNLHCVWE